MALFCNVQASHVIENRDVSSIYEVPLLLEEQNITKKICQRLGLKNKPSIDKLKNFIKTYKNPGRAQLRLQCAANTLNCTMLTKV